MVRFTPPRSGTFIYHTHLHDYRQLSGGMYGPLIVMDEGETFDPATDHVVVLGRRSVTSEAANILQDAASVVINGEREPRFVWKAATKHRVRLINITPDDIFNVSLADGRGSRDVDAHRRRTARSLPGAESTSSRRARRSPSARPTTSSTSRRPQDRLARGANDNGKWHAQGE